MSWSEAVDLSGKVALVTGGTEGIGTAVAADLARAGAQVVITSRSLDKARAAAAEISGDVTGLACDVRDFAACRALMAEIGDRWGRLDVLVNNAGLGIFKPIQEMSVDEWTLQVETNLTGVFLTSKAALPLLKAAGNGGEGDAWIVNIGSLASRNSFGSGSGYNASKFGLLGMTEAMMIDLRYEGIRTSIIMPGSVNTGFNDHSEDRDWAIQPEDVGRAVLQLVAYPTGTLVSRVEMRPSRPLRR
ncbi:MAG: SDR family oxidoreductase [Gemmatimonadetes bacterium]|nr:SDR family oxidoreductase [Gemmatimonadota bacterium]NNK62736.1 SDR family oxidoreductase [Gemmatimonadota bacterium]